MMLIASRLDGQQAEGNGIGTIAGVVVAEDTGAPLAAAAITILRAADSTLVGTSVAGSEGEFSRTGLPIGRYIVEIAVLGHAPAARANLQISEAQRTINLGTVTLRPAAIVLEGITATGERSAVILAADRSIYNIREMPVVEAGFATDALRAIPELEVDIDDNVRARGGEPQIYLDGRPLPMQGSARTQFLRSLRADRIDRIEYIPNPSARFEADGQSGIVNIVLRRDASLGTSGSVSINAGTRGTQGISSRINHQSGPVTFFGGGSLSLSQSKTSTFDLRQNFGASEVTYLEQNADRRRDGRSGGADLTAEWKATQRSTVWGIMRGNIGDGEEDALSRFTYLDQEESVTDRYERENFADNGTDGFQGALGYRRVIESQRDEFSAEIRYSRNGSDAGTHNLHFAQALNGDRLGEDPGLTRLDTSFGESLWSAQADLSKPLGGATRIDIGYRVNLRENDNSQDGEVYTPLTARRLEPRRHCGCYQ
jgi:hypothetical protein